MSDGIWRVLSSWIYGGSSFVSFVCDVAILVAIATIVRRHRPDAYQGLQVWAIGSLAVFVVMNVARIAMPVLARTSAGSMESYFRMNALLTIVGTGLHVVLVVLFIRGLTALAQPPKPVAVVGAPPYR
jgi:hypothetical protein